MRAGTETVQTAVRPARCPECSGTWALGTCSDLFLGLLALDHSRQQPWGEYHGVSVATYLLQHPSSSAPAMRAAQWSLLTVFAEEGIAGARALAASRVAHNRGGSERSREAPPVGVELECPPEAFAVTIADVSLDGSFPAVGFEARVSAWVQATIEAWTQPVAARSRPSTA